MHYHFMCFVMLHNQKRNELQKMKKRTCIINRHFSHKKERFMNLNEHHHKLFGIVFCFNSLLFISTIFFFYILQKKNFLVCVWISVFQLAPDQTDYILNCIWLNSKENMIFPVSQQINTSVIFNDNNSIMSVFYFTFYSISLNVLFVCVCMRCNVSLSHPTILDNEE